MALFLKEPATINHMLYKIERVSMRSSSVVPALCSVDVFFTVYLSIGLISSSYSIVFWFSLWIIMFSLLDVNVNFTSV